MATDFGQMMEGKKSWKDLLKGLVDGAAVGDGGEGSVEGKRRRRDR